jgi:hypothetical protein
MRSFLNCESTKFALKDNSNVKKSIKRTTQKKCQERKEKKMEGIEMRVYMQKGLFQDLKKKEFLKSNIGIYLI